MPAYNGWTNCQTWLVYMWLSNDKGLRKYIVELAATARDNLELAESIKDLVYEVMTENTSGLTNGMIKSCLNMINWHEIADEWKE